MQAHLFVYCIVAFIGKLESLRIPITDNKMSPYLSMDSSTTLTWNHPRILKALHSACFVEISARGIREIIEDKSCMTSYSYSDKMTEKLKKSIIHRDRGLQLKPSIHAESAFFPWKPEKCLPGYESLCIIESNREGGLVLPSSNFFNTPSSSASPLEKTSQDAGDEDANQESSTSLSAANKSPSFIKVSGKQNPQNLKSDLLLYYHALSRYACGISSVGTGRSIEMMSLNNVSLDAYTVTSCDIFQNNDFLVYEPIRNQLRILPQTYGPMAYCIVLFIAMVSLYGVSQSSDAKDEEQQPMSLSYVGLGILNTMASCAWLGLYCLHGIMFLTVQDEVSFVFSCVLCLVMSVCSLVMKKRILIRQSCFYCLTTSCISIYRTPENPYAFVLAIVLAIEMWRIIIKMSDIAIESVESNLSDAELSIPSVFRDTVFENNNGWKWWWPQKTATINDTAKANKPHYNKKKETYEKQFWSLILMFLNSTVTSFFLNCGCELSVSPQFEEFEDWIIYAGIGSFASFSIAIYYEQYHPTSV